MVHQRREIRRPDRPGTPGTGAAQPIPSKATLNETRAGRRQRECRCLVDRWPEPRVVLAQTSGNYAIRGDPDALDNSALDDLAGFIEAPSAREDAPQDRPRRGDVESRGRRPSRRRLSSPTGPAGPPVDGVGHRSGRATAHKDQLDQRHLGRHCRAGRVRDGVPVVSSTKTTTTNRPCLGSMSASDGQWVRCI